MQLSNRKLEARVAQSDIGPVYDGIAGIYNLWGHLTEARARQRALELAEIQDGQHLLEVAVGTGLAFAEVVQRNPHGRNFGLDLSAGMLKKAEQRLNTRGLKNYTLQVGTAFKLPLESETVDTLINNYMFDLLAFDAMERVLVEFHRVLKKGGKLILVNMTEGERWGSHLYDWIYSVRPKLMGGCRGVKLADQTQQQGFRLERREYYQQWLFPSEVIRAYKLPEPSPNF